jgi:hypothetical protein
MRRGFLVRLGLVLGVTLISGVAVDAALRRIWLAKGGIPAGMYDPHFHHRHPPHTNVHFLSADFDLVVKTNALGLRGREPAMPKPDGVTRLLVLGDSFIFGNGASDQDLMCTRLQAGLGARGHAVEVINGATGSYSTLLHYLALRDRLLSYQPDVVLLWYDLGDLQDDYWYTKNIRTDREGKVIGCDPHVINGRFSPWEWFRKRTAMGLYIDIKIVRVAQKIHDLGFRGYRDAKARNERTMTALRKRKIATQAPDVLDHERFLLLRPEADPRFVRRTWESLSGRYLAMIHQLLADRDIQLILGTYPWGMLAGPDQWVPGRAWWEFEPGQVCSPGLSVAVLEEFATQRRLLFLNPLESFRQATGREKLFFDTDGHFTAAGHRVLADFLLAHDGFLSALHPRPPARAVDAPHA